MDEFARYYIYSIELGYLPHKPFHTTNDREEAEIVCRDLGFNKNANVYVIDMKEGIEIYCTILQPRFKNN